MRTCPRGMNGERDGFVHTVGADMHDHDRALGRMAQRQLGRALPRVDTLDKTLPGLATHVHALHASSVDEAEEAFERRVRESPCSSKGVTTAGRMPVSNGAVMRVARAPWLARVWASHPPDRAG